MFTFLLGALFGAGGMYFGSEYVQTNCKQAAEDWKSIAQSKEQAQLAAQEMIMQWIHDGTLIDNMKLYEQRMKAMYGLEFAPQAWQDAQVIQASYVAK